jgi:alpha-tubulin suppressor-like RCC1 family protein
MSKSGLEAPTDTPSLVATPVPIFSPTPPVAASALPTPNPTVPSPVPAPTLTVSTISNPDAMCFQDVILQTSPTTPATSFESSAATIVGAELPTFLNGSAFRTRVSRFSAGSAETQFAATFRRQDGTTADIMSSFATRIEAISPERSVFEFSLFPAGLHGKGREVAAQGCGLSCASPSLPGFLDINWNHACALGADGKTRCWGKNEGRLGDGSLDGDSTVPVVVGGASTPLMGINLIATGAHHSCALVSGAVKCWGSQGNSIGDGDPSNLARPSPVNVVDTDGTTPLTGVTNLSAGAYPACATLTNGTVKCWGDSGVRKATPVANLTDVRSVSVGYNGMCATTSSGELWCAGGIGGGITTNTANFYSAAKAVGVANVAHVAMGNNHACVLHSDRTLSCWGAHWAGIGLSASNTVLSPTSVPGVTGVKAIAAGPYNTFFLKDDGTAWELSPSGPVPLNVSGVIAMAPGEAASCLLLEGGSVACRGAGGAGQLGDGGRIDSPTTFEGRVNGVFAEAGCRTHQLVP